MTTVRNPVTLARRVMDRSGHVLLTGDGAERFASTAGVERVDNRYFDTPRRLEELQRRRATLNGSAYRHLGTVGAVALDSHGHLAAATSTGG